MRALRLTPVLLLFAIACADPTAPEAPASIVVQSETVVPTVSVAGTVTWMRFTLPISIHNGGRVPMQFMYCASVVEKETTQGWRTVWSPICSLTAAAPDDIQPGETRELSLTVSASVAGPGGPRWESNEIAGTYRFRAGLYMGRGGPIPVAHSNAFVLLEP